MAVSCAKSLQSRPTLCDPMEATRLLYLRFFRQEYWSGLPFPTPEDLPDPAIEPMSPAAPALAGEFFTIAPP